MSNDGGAPPPGGIASFDEARRRVGAGDDPQEIARAFVASLSLDEKLWCLDGDEEFWPGLQRMAGGGSTVAGSGYAREPWIGARLPERGFPGIAFSDGPRGVAVGTNTCFPVSMARGATWDPGLEERIGDAIGRELRARGANLFGGVNVNLLRHPAWGRAQETYGEDPHHVGEMGAALARGVQRHAMACVKHFALNSIENARFQVDVQAGERPLHEVYLPHFRRVVDEGIACVMSAYNSVNGDWCGQNRDLLTGILRDEWRFSGIVISDWILGLRDAPLSVKAGLDIEMPFRQQRMQHLPPAIAGGGLRESDIDPLVTHIVATLLRFDHILSQPAPPDTVCASPEHRALAREAAAKSIVLLKNDGSPRPLLPLDAAKLTRVAVLGRLANTPNLGDRGSSSVTPPSVVTPLEGLRAALPGAEITHHDGDRPEDAARIARDADAAVVVVGCTFADEGEYISAQPALLMSTAPPRPPRPDAPGQPRPAQASAERRDPPRPPAPGGDRASLDLSPEDEALIHAVAAANPATIVVLMGGSAIMVERWHREAPAILMLWYPGMEGGRAIADVLLGDVNPSGRLPFAVPTDVAHLPAFDRDARTITYDLFHGQWLLDRDGHEARYPFGFGLSYGAAANILGARATAADDQVTISVRIANDSDDDVTEVVQAYAGLPASRVERPPARLAAFARVDLSPRSSRDLELTVPLRRLAIRADRAWQVEPGSYTFTVGRHAHDPAGVTATLALPARTLRA